MFVKRSNGMLSKKGPEAEKLVKETVQDISGVLQQRTAEAKKLAKEEK